MKDFEKHCSIGIKNINIGIGRLSVNINGADSVITVEGLREEHDLDLSIAKEEAIEKGVIPVEASSEDDILRRLWDDPNEDPQYVAAKLSQLN